MNKLSTISSTGNETDRMIIALEKYYDQKYRVVNRGAITISLGRPSKAYLLALYQEVIEAHSITFKTLPDLAVIRKVQSTMGHPATYEPPEEIPDERAENFAEQIARVIAETSGDLPPDLINGEEPESNHAERARIRLRVMQNRATPEEAWWIHVIDDLGEQWEPMPDGKLPTTRVGRKKSLPRRLTSSATLLGAWQKKGDLSD